MAQNLPWSDQTDAFLDDIDNVTQDKYSFSIRQLLLNPNIDDKDLGDKVAKAKTAVKSYFDGLIDSLPGEQERLTREMENVDAQYSKIEDAVTNKAAMARIPYLKPSFLDLVTERQEEIYINQYDSSVDLLIGKLVNTSTYVANASGEYSKYHLGSWVFSGQRTYVLTLNVPTSPLIGIGRSSAEINALLDGLSSQIKK